MEVLLLYSISARAALILGPQSGLVCPCCLVPKEFLWDLSEVIYPLRTRNGTLQLMQKADACNTKQKAYAVLLEQSIRNIPVCLGLKGQQTADLHPRILSSTTSANTLWFTAPSVQKHSTQSVRVFGVNIYGRWSKRSICHLQSFRSWMISRSVCLGICPFLTSGFLASETFLDILGCTTL